MSEARRYENPVETTTEIIPGDRGMEGGSWCRPPLLGGNSRKGKITSSSGRCHDRSSNMNQELGGEARIETVAEPSQAPGTFRPGGRTQLPRGLRLLLRRPERKGESRREAKAQYPRQKARAGESRQGAQGRR
jgi:hypothetical protein